MEKCISTKITYSSNGDVSHEIFLLQPNLCQDCIQLCVQCTAILPYVISKQNIRHSVIIKKQEGTTFELGSKTGNGRYHIPQHYKTIFTCTGYGSFILSNNGHSLNCFLSLSFKFHIWPNTWTLRQQQLMEMRPVVISLND